MSNLAYSIIYPQPRKLTLGLVLALSLFTLTVNAQNTVFRYNSSSGEEPTAQGTDIGTVQKATGAAEGDVIKVSDGAVFNTSVTNPVSGFTIESSTGNVVNVPVQAGYNFPQIPAAPVNAAFRNVSFTGAENYTTNFWRGDLNQNDIIGITISGNVSFSNFKDSVFDYYQTNTYKQYYPYKFTCTSGSTLTFSGNTTNGNGAAIVQLSELNGNGSFMTFSGNEAYGSGSGGGAIYHLKNLTGENNNLTFSNNKANGTDVGYDVGYDGYGGAIHILTNFSGSGNTLEFSGNIAERNGGAICNFETLSGENNTLTFTGNTAANQGGAIYTLTNFSGSGNTLKFLNNKINNKLNEIKYYNTAYNIEGGGAIHTLTDLSGSDNTLVFTGNTADEDNGAGGAIVTFGTLSGENNTLTFTGNTAADSGGAIIHLEDLPGYGNTLTFSGNATGGSGGAIIFLYDLSGNNNTLIFQNNKANGTSVNDGGGAIFELRKFSGSGNTLTFSGNTAANKGGAIGYFGMLYGDNNTLTFTGNTAGTDGGAIYSYFSIEFSGNNTLTFTGNKAGTKGNDIYLYGDNNRPANLTFNGGTYSFDGGIWLDKHPEGEYGTTTISDGAKVTIAGRDDDSVNEYEFRNVTLNANLTATVDDIEYLHGNFTVGENGLMTINKNQKTATIKSSTNSGVLDLVYNSEVETISISSGRIDIKGYMDASIELQNDAELQSVASFSPGNSAGRLETTGDFIASAGSLLIFEQEGDVYDQLIANNVTIDPETGIDLSLFTTFAPGAVYDIIIANGTLSVDQSWIDMIQSGLPEFVEASIYNGNTVRLKIDANAVPEPSTWALLILGAAGLAYMRKRSRQ